MKQILVTFIALFTFIATNAQQPQSNADTSSLLQAFKKGQVHGQLRYYFMATDNNAGLTDYFANAAGAALKYETAPFLGFQLGIGGSMIYNIGSSDLTKPDPATKQPNRYEIGLFDIENPARKTDIIKTEELYLSYKWKSSKVIFGKQFINTPFINLQDGRMRPNTVEGIWANINDIKKTKIETGFLYSLSPRSTTNWFNTGESIGLYPTGIHTDGTKSGYAGNLSSKGIGLVGITYTPAKNISLTGWEVWVENIFNTALLQADFKIPIANKSKLVSGFQYIRQDAINDGGNPDPVNAYFPKGGKAQVLGAKAGWENNRWQTSFNFTRITADGRYLMPREWGREPFYTFMPRERNDGFGDVNAYVVKVGYSLPKLNLKTQAGFGYFDLPDINNYALNKYGMPSYTQLNLDARYSFKGFLQGMDLQLLYVYKGKSGNTYGNDKYVINKVNMSLYNIVLNYSF
ncbi:OprD family outer membrane porin [Flavihumibacter profundi]|uniref:OprD family outer membrane porin n=1 Tax=Flavihumibacter profundi TaxID=2716883 RepID=UPI001CC5C633|nr:OprD family outer membrane porin [Flavihumibacter profundi]MBZ5857387.1 OprD family outer membrane porin [Flavihumibacter profundi]